MDKEVLDTFGFYFLSIKNFNIGIFVYVFNEFSIRISNCLIVVHLCYHIDGNTSSLSWVGTFSS